LAGKPEGKNHLEDLGINRRLIAKMDLRRYKVSRCGLDSSGSG
jgi:hypothetical protein